MGETEVKNAIAEQAEKDKEAKEKHGAIVVIRLSKDGKEKIAYLKQPNRHAIGVAMTQEKTSMTDACETLFVAGVIKEISPDAEEILNDDELFLSACPAIQAIVPFKKNSSRIL